MAKHLIYSELSPRGWHEQNGENPKRSEFEPCALTDEGRVVYKRKSTKYQPKPALTPYTLELQKHRRSLAETILAHHALVNPGYCQKAVDKVSGAIAMYWNTRTQQISEFAMYQATDEAKKYVYGDKSYGRISDSPPIDQSAWAKCSASIHTWTSVFRTSPRAIPKIMNLHDHFLRIFRTFGPSDLVVGDFSSHFARRIPGLKDALKDFHPDWKKKPAGTESEEQRLERERSNKAFDEEERKKEEMFKKLVGSWFKWNLSPQWQRMVAVENRVRPAEYFDPRFRGRRDRGNVPTQNKPGLLTDEVAAVFPIPVLARLGLSMQEMEVEQRVRGVDKFEADFGSMAKAFKKGIESANLNFGAGPSGTTGTLFQSALTFADALNDDELKQYLLACVVYLVGGGMHTCHEVFTTGSFLGIPYTLGKYWASLPNDFRSSTFMRNWQDEFWDLVGW